MPAAIAMFLFGLGLIVWAGLKLLFVILFGGSLTPVWTLLMASVLPFLVGWDFLPRKKRNAGRASHGP